MTEVTRRNKGTGGVYTIIGDTLEEVSECAKQVKGEIDPWASPSITLFKVANSKGQYVAEITYYGLD
jgi:hypothetical protein